MKKLIYIIIIGITFFVPVERVKIAMIEPIETIAVYREGKDVLIQTDTEKIGKGENALQALENLKNAADTIIYLDTARYLLVSSEAEEEARTLFPLMKGSAEVGPYGGGDVKSATEYAKVHGLLTKMRHWRPQ